MGEDDEAALLPAVQPGQAQPQQQQDAGSTAERLLSFEVCNGFAHQRVALLSGERGSSVSQTGQTVHPQLPAQCSLVSIGDNQLLSSNPAVAMPGMHSPPVG